MASHITHYYFGRRLFPVLPENAQTIIATYPDHYLIGNQGPDIFFYHITSKTHTVGNFIHSHPFMDLLTRNQSWLQRGPNLSPTWAYFFGLLAHFSLDISVHPYIDRIEKKIPLDHMTIERDFDRVILEEEGYDPYKFLSRDILPEPATVSRGISPIYESYTGVHVHHIHRAIASFRILQMFFHVDNDRTREKKHLLLKNIGLDGPFGGMLLNPHGTPTSIYVTNPQMKELMTLAYPIAQDAISTFVEGRLYPNYFSLNFNGK